MQVRFIVAVLALSSCVLEDPALDPMTDDDNANQAALSTSGDPDELVRAPGGRLVRRRCVLEVADDEIVTPGGIDSPRGFRAAPTDCDVPVLAPLAAAGPIAQTDGWAVSRQSVVSSWLRAMTVNWTVPPSPHYGSSQTIFLFPGSQGHSATGTSILQPVLQWGPSAIGGGQYYAIACWYISSKGTLYHSAVRQVWAGQALASYARGDNCSTGGSCDWVCTVSGNGGSSTLTLNDVVERQDSAIGGALEIYNVQSCSYLPGGGGSTSFWRIKVYDRSLSEWGMSWTQYKGPFSPDCGYSSSASTGKSSFVNINY
jgi:hypothetical protein